MGAACRPRGSPVQASGSRYSSAGASSSRVSSRPASPTCAARCKSRAGACGLARPTGLYDVRFGEDMHVLVGCGLGGGSLINAGVALRPDPRMFRDPVWPGQITAGWSARGGLCPSRAMGAPRARPRRGRTEQVCSPAQREPGLGQGAGCGAGGGQLRGQRQSGRRRAARLHRLRRLLRRLQRRRQEHRGPDLPAGRGAARRGNLHAREE